VSSAWMGDVTGDGGGRRQRYFNMHVFRCSNAPLICAALLLKWSVVFVSISFNREHFAPDTRAALPGVLTDSCYCPLDVFRLQLFVKLLKGEFARQF